MRTQASTSSSSRSAAGAEEGSRSKSEPKSAQGQRGADEKAEGDSRDWVRRPLHALPSARGQRLTPLWELPAKISMQTPAEHRVERQLVMRRVQRGGITHGPLPCLMEDQGSTVSGILQTATLGCCAHGLGTHHLHLLLAALSISNRCPASQRLAYAGCCFNASSACPLSATHMPSDVLQQ